MVAGLTFLAQGPIIQGLVRIVVYHLTIARTLAQFLASIGNWIPNPPISGHGCLKHQRNTLEPIWKYHMAM